MKILIFLTYFDEIRKNYLVTGGGILNNWIPSFKITEIGSLISTLKGKWRLNFRENDLLFFDNLCILLLWEWEDEKFSFNRQIFYLMQTLRTTISGILSKIGPMGPFGKLLRCEKYFESQPAHMGVGPHPIFQLTV